MDLHLLPSSELVDVLVVALEGYHDVAVSHHLHQLDLVLHDSLFLSQILEPE
jgi:hypothetical protein